MIKKTITVRTNDGGTITNDYFFHFSREELVAINQEHNNDMAGYLRRIVDSRRASAILIEMQTIVVRAYGKRSEDGESFVKSPELSHEFAQSRACAQLMDELSRDKHAAIRFVNGIVDDL